MNGPLISGAGSTKFLNHTAEVLSFGIRHLNRALLSGAGRRLHQECDAPYLVNDLALTGGFVVHLSGLNLSNAAASFPRTSGSATGTL